ncbi:MAG TPA: ATP-binding protein [Blastocatellia bacterium]|nr:ATP-binding protein [Blastocatellia bacterium]
MRKAEVNYQQDAPQVDGLQSGIEAASGGSNGLDRSEDRRPDLRLLELLPFLEERIVLKMPSELRHLDGVLDYLNDRMLKLGIVKPDDSEVLLALDEAIVNAVKHGNKCDPRKAVHIVAEFSAEGAKFTVSDEGAGFAREDVPDPTDPCRLLEPSGRGLLLITHIMDEVCFNQSGNRLEMFKRTCDKIHPGMTIATDERDPV